MQAHRAVTVQRDVQALGQRHGAALSHACAQVGRQTLPGRVPVTGPTRGRQPGERQQAAQGGASSRRPRRIQGGMGQRRRHTARIAADGLQSVPGLPVCGVRFQPGLTGFSVVRVGQAGLQLGPPGDGVAHDRHADIARTMYCWTELKDTPRRWAISG
ncbi:hypothetical protein G6F60_013584 [Rhizopus arrhizus]|nr:hypothetical protein G6F60_013584 [Rhizopus arrhizus]